MARCPRCNKDAKFVKLGKVWAKDKQHQRYQCCKCGSLCYVPPTEKNPKPIGIHILP